MNRKVLLAAILSFGLLMTACKKEESGPAKPVVTIEELGQGDSHTDDRRATIGASLHMDVEIVAAAKIDYILVELHHEEEEGEHKKDHHEEEWELSEKFSGTGITGLKNLDFHKDLSISDEAEAGEYHFHITVVDMEGNSGSAESELELVEQPTNVTVTNLSINAGAEEVSKAAGSFVISFDATATTGTLAKYSLEAHNHPASGNVADEYKIIDDMFTADFAGLTTASVNKTVTIAADAELGDYHVEIIITDSDGSEKVLEGHIDLID